MNRLRTLIALPAVLLTVAGVASTTTTADAAPAGKSKAVISVTPDAGLKDGQVVRVKGHKFPKATLVHVVQCSTKDATSCDDANAASATTTGKGAFKVKLTVHKAYATGKKSFIVATTDDGSRHDTQVVKFKKK